MDIINASDIARERFNQYIAELLNTILDDALLWGLFTFLLEQAKNYKMDNPCDCSIFYQRDREDAERQRINERGGSRRF